MVAPDLRTFASVQLVNQEEEEEETETDPMQGRPQSAWEQTVSPPEPQRATSSAALGEFKHVPWMHSWQATVTSNHRGNTITKFEAG